jgi:predicted N-acyltransferase
MEMVVATSVEEFSSAEWNRLFPGELEDWAYYHAVERSRLPGFSWLYFGVRERGVLKACVPAFITDYRLDTTVTGSLRAFIGTVRRIFPRFLRQRMLAFGSPVSEVCHLGFDATTNHLDRQRLLNFIFEHAEQTAKAERAGMLAVKDANATQNNLWNDTAHSHRLRRQPGLPTAVLNVDFDSVDDYLKSLSRTTRKDLRRKLKSSAQVRVEWRDNIDDIMDDVMRLYASTRERAEYEFEELTREYFHDVLAEAKSRARCATFWIGPNLVAFNLMLLDDNRLIDKFLGMDYGVAREHNLYFYTWMENVRYCIAHRIPLYQSGQGLHHEKTRLGSRLLPNWLWYRHRNRAVDWVLALLEPLARLDRNDPELTLLDAEPRS